ncbi:MAG: hypothetical protein ACQSGP_31125 [Frankia sp.]
MNLKDTLGWTAYALLNAALLAAVIASATVAFLGYHELTLILLAVFGLLGGLNDVRARLWRDRHGGLIG